METTIQSTNKEISDQNLTIINKYFTVNDLNYQLLIDECVKMSLPIEIRPLAWRIFLGVIPYNDISTWQPILHSIRCNYISLKDDIILPKISNYIKSSSHKSSPEYEEISSPLSKKDHAILSLIKLDVQRTFQAHPFFQREDIKQTLIYILFIYCKQNDKSGYQQGMNEIVGTLAFILQPQQHSSIAESSLESEKSFIFYMIYHNDFFEADLYYMFNELMSRGLSNLFAYSSPQYKDSYLGGLCFEERVTLSLNDIISSKDSELRKRIYKLFYIDLKTVNKKVYESLALTVDPIVFLLRWMVCLLNREFDINKVPKIWDAIFAYEFAEFTLERNKKNKGPWLTFVECFALGMLSMLEKRLLADKDSINYHQLLMCFPGDICIESIMSKAVKIGKQMNKGHDFFKEK